MKKILSIMLVLVLVITMIPIRANAQETMEISDEEIDKIIDDMTLREKIGQMIMPDFRFWTEEGQEQKEWTEMNDEVKKIMEDYHFGGIILFAQNVQETEQTTRLTHQIQQVALENGDLPYFISVDQEGGKVTRLGTGSALPGNMALGATHDLKAAYDYGKIVGEELAAIGINVNLAPVMDVNNNPENPVIGERSIGSDPELVAKIGTQIIRGIQDNNIATAIKHFPGHGDTATDSHLGMPEVDKSYEEVMKMELVPFKAGVDAGSDMLMTAHISYPQLETETAISKDDGKEINLPATLSPAILTGIVREDMGYDGIIITDAMNMQAISKHFGQVDAVIRTIKAGTDIPLMPTVLRSNDDVKDLEAIYVAIEEAIENGELTEERIEESVRRIIKGKARRGILDPEQYNVDLDEKISNALEVVGSKEHRALEREITQKGLTLAKNNNNTLPFRPKSGDKVVIVTPYDNEIPSWKYGFDRLQRENVIGKDVDLEVYRFSDATDAETIKGWLEDADYIIGTSEIINANNLKKDHWISRNVDVAINYAKENDIPNAVVSIGKPYDVDRYMTDAIVMAYGAKGMDPTERGTDPVKTYGPNIPTSLDIVFGKVNPVGKLPVDVPVLDENYSYTDEIAYEVGYGLSFSNYGWEKVDDDWYYFNKNTGEMVKDKWIWAEVTVDGETKYNWKYFNKDGKNQTTFYIDGENVWLSQAGPDKEYYRGWWENEAGMRYYFREESGSRVHGWQYIDGSWKYFRTSGTMVTGWQYIDDSWRFFRDNGDLVIDEWLWLPVDIDSDGKTDKNNWKYFNKDGESQTTFYIDNGNVWLSQSGPNKEYYRGWWENEAGMKYYFRETSGSRVTGWQYIGGNWRYFRTSGTMVTGKQWIDEKWRNFDSNGALIGKR